MTVQFVLDTTFESARAFEVKGDAASAAIAYEFLAEIKAGLALIKSRFPQATDLGELDYVTVGEFISHMRDQA